MIKIKIISKKSITIIFAVLLLLSAMGFYFYKDSKKTESNWQDGINFGPPTEQEKKAGDAAKEKILQQEEARSSNPSSESTGSKKNVTPIISYAALYGNNIEIGASVNEVFEDGGKCTAKISKDGQEKTTTVIGEKNVSYTTCPVMIFPRDKLSSGTWSVVVEYGSSSANGTSTASIVEVK